jgi:hypothetical protein
MPAPTTTPPALSAIACTNIQNCSDVDAKTKQRYLDTIAAAGTHVDQAKRLHDKLREAKSNLGATITPLATEGLGNLAPVEDLKYFSYFHFYSATRRKITYDDFCSLVDGWISYHDRINRRKPPTTQQNNAALDIHGSSVLVRDAKAIWLFRNPNRTAYAFDGLLNKWLPNRLGLIGAGDRLTLSFTASAATPLTRPTFFDAPWSYLDYWDASGRTRPLKGTPKKYPGLEEVVAKPPMFKDINGPVRIF